MIKNIMKAVTNKLNLNQNDVENAYNNTLPHLKNVQSKADVEKVLKNLGVNQDFLKNKMLPILKSEKSQRFAQNFGINLNGIESQINSLFNNSNNNNNSNSTKGDQLQSLKNNLKKLK